MNKKKPIVEPPVTPVPDEETYEEFIEWTPEEEEAFLKILGEDDFGSSSKDN